MDPIKEHRDPPSNLQDLMMEPLGPLPPTNGALGPPRDPQDPPMMELWKPRET